MQQAQRVRLWCFEARLLVSENKRATARLMHAKGIKQQTIAEELSVSRMTIHRWVSDVT